MLSLDVLTGPSDPVLTLLRLIGELDLEVILILLRDAGIQYSLGVRDGAATCHQRTLGIVQW